MELDEEALKRIVAAVVAATESKRDKLVISTPSKGGELTIYGDFDDPADFMRRIKNAIMVREYAENNYALNREGKISFIKEYPVVKDEEKR